eukprot:TRINITY_DN2185_c0_g1_i12.p1 TRINITY_DN2185_c0_g1~~TRINITY_DN2185_c0_g1_i12.p1  ORF type:complete len:648 (-),score=69.71 TRINITY_DN2185_c0_g1_i12:247-2190(-)
MNLTLVWRRINPFRMERFERGMDRLTLKFQEQGVENGFSQSRTDSIVAGAVRGCMGVSLACLISFSINALWLLDAPTTQASEDSIFLARFHNYFYLGNVATSLALVCSLTSPFRRRFMSHFMTELMITVWCCIMMVSLPLVDPNYSARLFGKDPHEVYDAETDFVDTTVLLGLLALVIISHVTLQIRWISLWPSELVALFSYLIPAFVLGSDESYQAPYNAMILVLLIFFVSRGKRSLELQERILFSIFVKEKCNRFQAEFELSQKSLELSTLSKETNHTDDDCSEEAKSTKISAPSTTPTGEVFKDCDLDEIRNIGLKEQWLIKSSDLKVMHNRVIGRGSCGVVIEGVYQGVFVALKSARATTLSLEASRGIYNELRIMRRLRCPNIVFMYGACLNTEARTVVLVLELVHGATLKRFVHLGDEVCDLDRAHILCDVSKALSYLHTRQPFIVHGDLKDTNVVAERWRGCSHVGSEAARRFRAKLHDFGLSRLVTRNALPLGGTLAWVAPEILRTPTIPPNGAADVFSFGRLAFFVICGLRPFEGVDRLEVRSVLKCSVILPLLPWPSECNLLVKCFRSLVEHCSSVDPSSRPTIQHVRDAIDSVPDQILVEPIEAECTETDIFTRIQEASATDDYVHGDDRKYKAQL